MNYSVIQSCLQKRTEQLNSYKSKLDELKKKYLGSEEEIKKDDKK